MPRCHFVLIIILIAIIMIYEELFKNMNMSKMLLRIGLVKILILNLFSKVIRCDPDEELIYGD